jgi:hypothetical protein
MATSKGGVIVSGTAAAALTKYQAVKMTSTGFNVATANTDSAIGTVIDDAASGAVVSVALIGSGVVKGIASASITAGAYITTTTGGKWVTWSTGAGAKHIALTGPGADGDIFEIVGGTAATA